MKTIVERFVYPYEREWEQDIPDKEIKGMSEKEIHEYIMREYVLPFTEEDEIKAIYWIENEDKVYEDDSYNVCDPLSVDFMGD